MAITTNLAATSNVDIDLVASSFTDANEGNYLFSKIPSCLVLGKRDGRSNVTTFELANLSNWMLYNNGLAEWEPGDSLPDSKSIDSTTVTITVRGRASHNIIDRPSKRSTNYRLQDLEQSIVPGLLTEIFQGAEAELVAHLDNATNWGATKTWAGAGDQVLDVYHADTNPLQDLAAAYLPLRKYQSLPGMGLVCYMDSRVAHVLAGYEEISGGGVGSGLATAMPMDALAERLRAILGLDEVSFFHGMNATGSDDAAATGMKGQTVSLANAGGGILWGGVVDKRGAEVDLRSEDTFGTVDGALCMAWAARPYVSNWIDEATECEYFHGRSSFRVFSPRGAVGSEKLGFYFSSAKNLS